MSAAVNPATESENGARIAGERRSQRLVTQWAERRQSGAASSCHMGRTSFHKRSTPQSHRNAAGGRTP